MPSERGETLLKAIRRISENFVQVGVRMLEETFTNLPKRAEKFVGKGGGRNSIYSTAPAPH